MSQKQQQNYLFPLIIVFIVCFLIGFITTMNNSMIAFLSEAFNLTAQQGQYVNTAFYGAYLLAIPFAMLMSKIGYKGTLLLGLAVAGIGFVINSFGINAAISAGSNVYIVFLLSMCIVAMGVVMLQNVANPYVMVLGKPESGAFRMTLSQALNSVATTVAPIFITTVIIAGKAPTPDAVPGPFLGLGIFTLIICGILVFLKLPKIDEGKQAEEESGEKKEYERVQVCPRVAWRTGHLHVHGCGDWRSLDAALPLPAALSRHGLCRMCLSGHQLPRLLLGRHDGGPFRRSRHPHQV